MSYDSDFYAWATEQAALLRTGRLDQADLGHIAEEIESMGRSEKRELESRLTVLLIHLLKWRFQPERQGPSWRATIRIQRHSIIRHLRDNPSLKAKLPDVQHDAWETALIAASAETGLAETAFPASCPWSTEEILDAAFWP